MPHALEDFVIFTIYLKFGTIVRRNVEQTFQPHSICREPEHKVDPKMTMKYLIDIAGR
jgi:hypothetical protein